MPIRKKSAGGELRKPLLGMGRIVYENASFRLRKDVPRHIAEYVLYVKEMTGEKAAPEGSVDRGMQRLFDADRRFRQWPQRKEEQSELGARTEKAHEPIRPKNAVATSAPLAKEESDA